MSNTSIQLKKSGITGNTPVDLQYGEIALNYADGRIYYKDGLGGLSYIYNVDSFGTINANSSLVLATSPTDILSIVPGNNISISTNTVSKSITIDSLPVLTHVDTPDYILPANTTAPGQPVINLNDGRMFIQLGDGKVVDISSTPVGKTYYVSTNGNDDYEGTTPGSAKATIKAAVAAASPGDSVIVSAGIYIENTPIIVPQNVQIQGSGERNCIIQPQVTTNDVFWLNNNSYITGFKFQNYTGSAIAFPNTLIGSGYFVDPTANTFSLSNIDPEQYDNYYNSMSVTITSGTGVGQTSNIISYVGSTNVATLDTPWSTIPDSSSSFDLKIRLRKRPAAANSRYSTYITGSPYVYNSSSVTTTGTGIKIDGNLATGNKSMISAQFTQVNSGGIGVHVLNDGYSQLVSMYSIFCDIGFLAESGGTASMGNCNVNFGNKGLVANGKGKLAMTATIANTSNAQFYTVDLNNITANTDLGVTATIPYTGLIMIIDTDEPGAYYPVSSATSLIGGNTTVTFANPVASSFVEGTNVSFYQQSQLRASGQTFEYVGSGTNITALPKLGGVANSQNQIVRIDEGAVFATSTDQSGNFTVADLTINQETSTITGRTFTKSLFAEMTPYILAIEG
jgi:hypothetical protein